MLNHFDILAPIYDRLMGAPDVARLALHLRLPPRGWLLDLGGGTGRVSSRLRGRFDRAVVCDPSGRMLAKARQKRLDGVCARAEVLPFPDAAFDRVLVVDALHHFADPPSAMGEIARVLKPGGRVVIEEFDADRAVVRMAALAEKIAWMKSRFFRPQGIRRMMRLCGLEADIADRHRFSAWVVGDKP
jgi:demethylmenaquinone methyltransferase/2-methoxy-6-polyprenyl-1,4-benzoquinol methylase